MTISKTETRAEKLAVGFAEAAAIIDLGERKFRSEYMSLGIPYVRLNGRTVFPIEGLRRWLEARTIIGEGAA